MNATLPKKLALSLAALALLATMLYFYDAYHSVSGMRGLILLAFPIWAAFAVVVAFASGWLMGSVWLYIQSRRAGMPMPLNRVMLSVSALVVFLVLFLGGWSAYEGYLETKIYNLATSTSELDDLSKNLFVNNSAHLQEYLARHRSAGADALARLYTSEVIAVRRAVCAHPAVSAGVLSQCAAEINTEVLLGVTKNPATPVAVVERLSQHDDSSIRRSIGFRRDISLDLVERLSRDAHAEVRASILYHPQLTGGLLTRMANDPDKLVRVRVAANKNTPLPALLKLAGDSDTDVHWALLRDKAPWEVLEVLASNQSERIRTRAKILLKRRG